MGYDLITQLNLVLSQLSTYQGMVQKYGFFSYGVSGWGAHCEGVELKKQTKLTRYFKVVK